MLVNSKEAAMARKLLLGFAVLVLIASLAGVIGLGFLYYRLNTQLKSTQAELQTLTENNDSLSKKYDALQAQYAELQGQNNKLTEELKTANSKTDGLQIDLDKSQTTTEQVKTRLAVLNSIFIPTITGEIFAMTEAEALVMFQVWTENIDAVNDPTLSQKFQAYLEGSEQEFNEFLMYLLGSMEDILQ
jgi:septal ring factor EnvC (AmiA/AmiB activator)